MRFAKCLLFCSILFCISGSNLKPQYPAWPKGKCACCIPDAKKNNAIPRYVDLKTDTGIPFHWTHAVITYTFTASDQPQFVRPSFRQSFDQWERAINWKLIFVEVQGDADITIAWQTSGYKGTSFSVGNTYDHVLEVDGSITSSSITMNAADYSWHSGAPRGATPSASIVQGQGLGYDIDLDGASLHEIGHAIGLNHSDLDPSKIVGPLPQVPTMNSILLPGCETLHEDDIVGAQNLYYGAVLSGAGDYQKLIQTFAGIGIQYTNAFDKQHKLPKGMPNTTRVLITGNETFYFTDSGSYVGETAKNKVLFKVQ